jgi:hypothetical protein
VVDTEYGLGGSLGDCRLALALPKGGKYQMVKTQTESHDGAGRRLEFVAQILGGSPKFSSSAVG